MSDTRTHAGKRHRMTFLRTLVLALLSGLVSTLLWTVAFDLMSEPASALAQGGDSEQPTPTQEVRYVQISVETFFDIIGVGGYDCAGCNGVLDAGDRTAGGTAPQVEIVVRDGLTGLEIARQTTVAKGGGPVGRAFFSVPERETLIVELAQIPAGAMLCPNSSRTRVIRPAEMGYGVFSHTFTFWQGCSVSFTAATATPVPIETVPPPPTDTPAPTDTPVPTATPPPPPPPTATPLPTEEPKPTVVSVVLQPPTPTPPPPPPAPTEPPPPTPTEPPPTAEPTQPAAPTAEPTQPKAPTPTAEPPTSTPVSEEPTVPPAEPTPIPTDVPEPAIRPPAPDEGTSSSEAAPPSHDQRPAIRTLPLSTDQQDLQRAIAKALSETEGSESLDEQALAQVLARAVEIRADEKANEMRLAYEQSLREERRQGMLMAFLTGVAGVFTASFWKALAKALLSAAAKAVATASPGWGTGLLLAVMAPLAGVNRRQCVNCRHYQPSNMRGQGWCRNPRLYARHVRHLVHASDLDCARTHLPDLWEAIEKRT